MFVAAVTLLTGVCLPSSEPEEASASGGKISIQAGCVYRQLKRGRSGDEVRPGWRVN
jgi:hypothetical protein